MKNDYTTQRYVSVLDKYINLVIIIYYSTPGTTVPEVQMYPSDNSTPGTTESNLLHETEQRSVIYYNYQDRVHDMINMYFFRVAENLG